MDVDTQEQIKGKETQESSGKDASVAVAAEALPREEISPIDVAKEVAARLERANAETKKLLDRQEKIISEGMLTGKGYAGQVVNRTPSPKDKAKEFWQGSPVEGAIDQYG
jgi:predicted transcriptional regulator